MNECSIRKKVLDNASIPMLVEQSHPQIAHARACAKWRMGKKHGPCTCGASDATERLLDFLATIAPKLKRCACGHRGTDHFGGLTRELTPTACNRMGCECKAFNGAERIEKVQPKCNCIAMAMGGNGPMPQNCTDPSCQYYAERLPRRAGKGDGKP